MKKYIFFILFSAGIFLIACKGNSSGDNKKSAVLNPSELLDDTTKTENFTTIKWLDSTVDFGVATYGENVKIVFHFMNTGARPLYIIYARPGCGCTVADFTKGAILPGKQGVVTATYDTKHGRAGEVVHKSVFVTCNVLPATQHTLTFTGMVREKN